MFMSQIYLYEDFSYLFSLARGIRVAIWLKSSRGAVGFLGGFFASRSMTA
jgi:hypothetical protein